MSYKNYYNSIFKGVSPTGGTPKYTFYYQFWIQYLLERCVNIFKWTGLPFKQRYLELYIITIGYCGLVKLDNSDNPYDAVKCSMTGVTNYYGEFTNATAVTPMSQAMFHIFNNPFGELKLDRQGIIAENNQTRTPLMPLIEYYANILSHIDLTLQKVCIKMRTNALIKGTDSKSVESIKAWYGDIEKGSSTGILDENTFNQMQDGIIIQPLGSCNSSELSELITARIKYINSFFSDIGVNTAEEKRERLISSEVSVGFNRVLFNISDMLATRQETADNIMRLFGGNVSVELNPNLNTENFVDTMTIGEGDNNE